MAKMARVDVMQVVSEPRRREILHLVWDQELSAGDIARQFDVTFGAVSQHLGILREAGFVTARREGNRRLYRADKDRLGPLAKALEAMWADALDRLADAVEADVQRG
jgi:DNA-binding transcriptional ArsR family regulator